MTESFDEPKTENLENIYIENKLKTSFMDYAMSVIVSRALPDVRDGLKPVHRRILYSMNELDLMHNKPYKKCARIVGEVLGKYHPHGDTAVYDSAVRMAQDFSLRYPLVHGQGNFGSIDGDSPAAMRYCITGDSLIITDKGLVKIENLSKKEKINNKIVSFKGIKNKAIKFFDSGKHTIYELKTKLDYNIKGSSNHPILCFSKNMTFEWKTLDKINNDDYVLINRNYNIKNNKKLDLKKYWPKSGFKNNIELPQFMNKDLAFLLGILISEGSYHNKQILFINKDKELYDKIKEILFEQFKGIQIYERKLKDCYELSIYEQKVVMFLENIGLLNVKSDKKEIPFSILQSSDNHIKSFLKSLFEVDGCVEYKIDKRHNSKNIIISYSSKSKTLMKQLKVLFLNYGIITSKYDIDKRNDCFKLRVLGIESKINFKSNIAFFSNRKNEKLNHIDQINTSRMSKTDVIPFLNSYLRNKYKNYKLKKYNFDRYNKIKEKYNLLIKIIDKKDKNMIDFLLKHNYLFTKVKTITKLKKKEKVYSIKVDSKCHSFVANGFINHNTEAKLQKISEEMLKDLNKDTVDFKPNFDESLKEPIILPSMIPNLLINGSSGIAVGMATNIAPHNINEICDAIIEVINNPEADTNDLLEHVKGPDFPTGGIIYGRTGILNAINFGKGHIKLRAKFKEEVKGNHMRLIMSEIPYTVNKAELIKEIARNVNDKKILNITGIRDESSREGIRVVFELKRDTNIEILKNNLYKKSRCQITFAVKNLALINNRPKVFNLKEMISEFISHRRNIITRRTLYDLKKAKERMHLLIGFTKALDKLDDTIKIIRASQDVKSAKEALIEFLIIDDIQSKAILELKLQKLTSMERDSIINEYNELKSKIDYLNNILENPLEITNIIKDETQYIKDTYGDIRRTEIIDAFDEDADFNIEDFIEDENVIVVLSKEGYIKRVQLEEYKEQHRGGKGVTGLKTKEEDYAKSIFSTTTKTSLLIFTNQGRLYWLKVYRIPDASRSGKGKPIVNFINLNEGESVSTIIPIKEFKEDQNICMVTQNGVIKKVNSTVFKKPRKSGVIAITLREGDKLIDVLLTNESSDVVLATKNGNAIKFHEKELRTVGKTAIGVTGIKLKNDDKCVSALIASKITKVLTITRNGYGKKTMIDEYRTTHRAGSGIINIKTSERNGKVSTVLNVTDDNNILIITKKGIAIRIRSGDIPVIGRNTQGVRLIKLKEDDYVIDATVIKE